MCVPCGSRVYRVVPSGIVWDPYYLGVYWVNPSDLGVSYVWDKNAAAYMAILPLGSIKIAEFGFTIITAQLHVCIAVSLF